MQLETKHKRSMVIGALIGAILGAGAAYLLITMPTDLAEDEEIKPLTATELIGLTSLAASLIRRLDDFRRRI